MLSKVLLAWVNDVAGGRGCGGWAQYGVGSDSLRSSETTGDGEGGWSIAARGDESFRETGAAAWGNERVSTTGGAFATENDISA